MTIARRAALIGGPILAALAAGRRTAAARLATTTIPAVQGEIRTDDAARATAADDFGHLLHRAPEVVVLPASNRDVAAAVSWAAGQRRGFAAQGRRHSTFGRAQVDGGVVADMTRLRTVHEVRDDQVSVDAGATWRDVLAVTLPRGLAPTVLPDYLDLSVGGTLAVGGVGGRTARRGAISDTVVELQVVTGRGEELTCSPSHHPDLFDAVRAGLGQVAVVTRAALTVSPAPRSIRRFLLSYPDLPTMLTDQRLLAGDGRFDVVQGAVQPVSGGWRFQLDAAAGFSGGPPDDAPLLAGLSDDRARAQPGTMRYPEYLGRLDGLERALRAHGQWSLPHPWLMTFVGDAAVESVVAEELAALTPADLGAFGQVSLSALHRQTVRTPLLRLPADELCFTVNLVRNPTTDDPAEAARLLAVNRAAYDRIRAMGGTLYPVSALSMSETDWREHFGSAFGALATAKTAHDPEHVLTPGYEIYPQ
jgi:cytokinin dehydrogenase